MEKTEIKCPYGYSAVSNFTYKEFECGLRANYLEQIQKLQAENDELKAEKETVNGK